MWASLGNRRSNSAASFNPDPLTYEFALALASDFTIQICIRRCCLEWKHMAPCRRVRAHRPRYARTRAQTGEVHARKHFIVIIGMVRDGIDITHIQGE